MLYAIADGRRHLDELVARRAEVFRQKQGIDLRIGHRFQAIDPHAKQVKGKTIEGLNASEAREAGFDPVEFVIQSRSRAHTHPGSNTTHVRPPTS